MQSENEPTPLVRSVAGGFLMGLANLVPGISGGTMILAVGLYERFINAVADVTRLRWSRSAFFFLALMAVGAGVALVSLSGVAVDLVANQRWVMYSLFIGMTLGGVPELWRESRPLRPTVVLAILAGFGGIVALAMGLSETRLAETFPVLMGVGAIAASSMILPGVSGSYMLLIFGMYDVVIGSLSASALREDWKASAAIIVPVGLGAALGIALLSNVLKFLLRRFSAASHGALLGLLLGSVMGLWPFQQPVHPDLADKPMRKATAMVVSGADHDAIREKYGERFDDATLERLANTWAGKSKADLKALGMELERFQPTGGQIGSALALLVAGFLITRSLGRKGDAA